MKANREMINLTGHEQIDHNPIKNTFHVSLPRQALKNLGINKSARISKYT
jgi:hypothetical protein